MRPSTSDADPVGQRGRVLEVVGDEQRGERNLGEELAQLRAHARARVSVERSEGLVEEEHRRDAGESPCQGDALALAARELARPRVAKRGDPEQVQQLVRPLRPGVGDVLRHGHVREEGVLLEDEADRAMLRRKVDLGLRVEPRLAREGHVSPLGPQEPCDRSQHARLARARRADERDRLATDLEL